MFAGYLVLSPSVSSQFTLEICMRRNHKLQETLKPPILGFKVVQVHRCWHY